jgi:hypothetical protein
MFTSERIPHDSGLYHERIYWNDDVVAKVMSNESKGTFWYVTFGLVKDGFKTIADTKQELFNHAANFAYQ